MKEPKRCTFMVPVAYNDGRQIEPEVVLKIKRVLDTRFEGFTVSGPHEGSWKGQREWVWEYMVYVPSKRVDELRNVVKVILRELGQKAMAFEVHESRPEIIDLFADIDDGTDDSKSVAPKRKASKKGNIRRRKGGDDHA